ncbi:CRISPR-associated helicase Cas3' [Streptomyces diastaticus]
MPDAGVSLESVEGPLGVLWGKSAERAGGQTNLLLSHLLDTGAVAERLWESFLAPSTRGLLDEVAGGSGRGRRLFAWLCAVHDLGKATPAFQYQWEPGARAVRAAGLRWHGPTVANQKRRWRHEHASAYLLMRALRRVGWAECHVAWVWPLAAGHHGMFPDEDAVQPPRQGRGQLQGGADWEVAQAGLLERVTVELGFEGLAEVQPVAVPTRAVQLHVSGLIVMADWIASDKEYFPGLPDVSQVSMKGARERAGSAWTKLGLRGGWGALAGPGPEAFRERFGVEARPSQRLVMQAARDMEGPGLLVVEAPMGEGKTKAALMAAEILAARFGADGVFVGMPTQATSDPMFGQVRAWLQALGRGDDLASQVALLHGKRMFNKEWRGLVEGRERVGGEFGFAGVDEFGCEGDVYGLGVPGRGVGERSGAGGPAEWFLGAKRGLLCPFVVGTFDQLLLAATRSRHVMLRMAGLAGKVVVLDEVHAADVYMSQFLVEGLRWLGQAGVPVVLLSATLPPGQRRELVEAYVAGAGSREELRLEALPEPGGCPSVTSAWSAVEGPCVRVDSCEGWRPDLSVALAVCSEPVPGLRASRVQERQAQQEADVAVVDLLRAQLEGGGCALVVRNTVARAQSLYSALAGVFGVGEVMLLHGRLAAGARAERTERCLGLLGVSGPGVGEGRPHRLVVVATQLVEQSFDVDVDLLVSDVAPVDLLLQRIGRLHRHGDRVRPPGLVVPQVFLTGLGGGLVEGADAGSVCGGPAFIRGSEVIYGRHLLLRTAAVVADALRPGSGCGSGAGAGVWQVPGGVPGLVAAVYGDEELVPAGWRDDAGAARVEWEERQRERAQSAVPFLLTRRGDKEGVTLAGLHRVAVAASGGAEGGLDGVVRDGEMGEEVVLVVREGEGEVVRTLSGRALSVNGDVADELIDDVLAGTVRLPGGPASSAAAVLGPLPGWVGHPRLRYARALVVDGLGWGELGEHRVHYDDVLGLTVELAPRWPVR